MCLIILQTMSLSIDCLREIKFINNILLRENLKITSREFLNLCKALKYIEKEEQPGCISLDFIKEIHRYSMKNIIKNAGIFSTNIRYTLQEDNNIHIYKYYKNHISWDIEIQHIIDMYHENRFYAYNNDKEKIIETIAIFVINFLAICHPFSDGNGRITKLLINHMISEHSIHHYIIFTEKEQKIYVNALHEKNVKLLTKLFISKT